MARPISLDDVLALSAPERLSLVEAIWDTLAREPGSVPVTDAQRRELDARLADLRANPGEASTWDEVRARLQRKG